MPFTGDTVFGGVLDICTFGKVDTCERRIGGHLLDRVCADVWQTLMPAMQVTCETRFFCVGTCWIRVRFVQIFVLPCCELGVTLARTFGDIFVEVFEREQVDNLLPARVEVCIVELLDFGRH